MKILSLFLFLFLTISCKEEKNSVENILLNNLKESIIHYDDLGTSLIEANSIKNEESGRVIEELDTLKNKSQKIKKFLLEIEHLDKENQITKYEKFIAKVNLKGKYKFLKIDKSNLENLSNEISYYYIKNDLNKNLYRNICDYQSDYAYIYCGYTKYSDEKFKLMDKLKVMDVQKFKDSICKSNM